MFSLRRLALSLMIVGFATSMGMSQRVQTSKPDPGSITCDVYVAAEVLNGVFELICHEEKGSRNMIFNVSTNNTPSPEVVASFVNPYRMAFSQLGIVTGAGPSKWPWRILVRYNESKQVTGISYIGV